MRVNKLGAGLMALLAVGCGSAQQAQQPNYTSQACDQTQEYDEDNGNVSRELIDSIYAGTYELKVKANFIVEENGHSYSASLSEGGTGYLLNDGYMLTARHVVQLSPRGITTARPNASVTAASTEITAKKGGAEFRLEIDYISSERDFAILRADQAYTPGIYLSIGYSYEMEHDDFVYLFSGRNEPYVKEGKFSVSEGDETFRIETEAESGDSGGIVVAFRNGCPEIVGILNSGHAMHDARILRIEQIIKEYEHVE